MNFFTKVIKFLKKTRNRHRANSNRSSKNIAIVDTNLVPIPKYGSLSKEDKQQVKTYYSELSMCNPSTFLKYGKDFEKELDSVSQLIIKILFKIRSQSPSYTVRRFKNDPNNLLNF